MMNSIIKGLNASDSGKVYWLTGLAGAGKTTIGKSLYNHLKNIYKNIVFLDGDQLRAIFGNKFSYSIEERKELATCYSRLCQFLSEQDLIVVICTISLFHEIHEWNRKNLKNYTEIYIKVPLDILKKRDQKNLYSNADKGKISNVLGMDSSYEEPLNPDIVLQNDGTESIENFILKIIEHIKQ